MEKILRSFFFEIKQLLETKLSTFDDTVTKILGEFFEVISVNYAQVISNVPRYWVVRYYYSVGSERTENL